MNKTTFALMLALGLNACEMGYKDVGSADAGDAATNDRPADAAPAADQQPAADTAPAQDSGTVTPPPPPPVDSGTQPPPADVQQPVDNGPRCYAPRALCGTDCVDTNTDTANCGFCGRTCPSGNTCVAGTCTPTCAAPLALCGSTCVNNQMDVANCGGCGRACPPGRYCAGGSCATPGPVCMSGSMRCPGITTCVAVLGDRNNCGACGNRCPSDQACLTGVCRNPCAAGETLCGLTTCIDTRSDVANCGACGTRCTTGYSCVAGVCNPPAPSCIPSMCPARSNANAVCTTGTCGFACYLSYGNCNGNAGDGCETALTTDSNCGGCGRVCTGGTHCESGACVLTPPPPARYLRAQRPGAYVCVWDLNADPVSAIYCSTSLGGQLRVNTVGAYWPGNHIRSGLALDDPRTTPSDRIRWIGNDIGLVGSSARAVGYTTLQFEATNGTVTEYLLDVAQSCVDVCHPSYPSWRETKVTIRTRPSASVCPTTCDGR